MTIRQAIASDAGSIGHLLTELGYPRNESFVTERIKGHSFGNYHLLVAEVDSEITGFISMHWFDMFHSNGLMGRITAVCVNERFRSQGLGKLLTDAAEKFLYAKGCSNVEVTCNLRRTRTHEFYKKNGYGEDSKRFIKKLEAVPSMLPPVA